jgi:hypothetical protein
MAYWFDCEEYAYIYAVATAEKHRGKGISHTLMAQIHEILTRRGYDGCILVPGEESLRTFYRGMGYENCGGVTEFDAEAGDPLPLRKLGKEEYAVLRRQYLPQGGVVQEGESLRFLEALESLYAADGLLLAAHEQGGRLVATELLGDPALAPRVLSALGLSDGRFRIAGGDTPFAMIRYLSQKDFPPPAYFALAFD